MVTKVIMPQMSLTMQVGVVSGWLKKQGDKVEKGELICTIEGDKASLDIESPASGILLEIVAKEGEEFPVKKAMAYIGDPGDTVVKEESSKAQSPAQTKAETPQPQKSSDQRIKSSPIARRLAEEMGIDLAMVAGTGPDGLIGKEDVLAYQEDQSGKGPSLSVETSKELSTFEKTIAQRMAQSNQEIPHFHLTTTCDVLQADNLRKQTNQSNGIHITLTDLVLWAVSRSLAENKLLNASFDGGQVVFHDKVNTGLAVNTPKGLLVVVLKNADKKSLKEIAEEREQLVDRAASGKQTPDDLGDCTFTISNLGMYGIEFFDPIITPGQVGILGVGATMNNLILNDEGKVVSGETMAITLGCDHRIVDGVSGAEFLANVKAILENPPEIFS